jgi:hypothetical protein
MILMNLALAVYLLFTPGGVVSGILLLLFTALYGALSIGSI